MKKSILHTTLKTILPLILSVLCASLIHAQQSSPYNKASILLMGKNDGSKITLRWRMDNYADYNLARESGFYLEQKTVNKGESFSSQIFKKVQTIAVANKETFLSAIQNNPRNKSLIASSAILFPDNTVGVHEKDISGHIDLINKHNQQHGILMMQADLDISNSILLGLRAEIDQVDPSKEYYYRIVSDLTNGQKLISNIIKIEGDHIHILPQPHISAFLESDSTITLQWKKDAHESFYMAYLIERANISGSFKNILSVPFFYREDPLLELGNPFIQFQDKVESNTKFNYRIRGISPFGEISDYSNIVDAQAQDRTPPTLPDSLWLTLTDSEEVRIQWNYRYSKKSTDLQTTEIERSLKVDADFVQVTSSNTNAAIDKPDLSNPYYFYRLKLVDKNNNFIHSDPVSISIPDTIPPSTPVLLSATLDTSGLVMLVWEENVEKDILGYQVVMANNENGIYTNLTNKPYKETTWTTNLSLNNLNRDVYYKIQSLDKHFNHSPFSDPIKLIRPDKHPPLPAYFKDFFVEENAIEMTWQKSNSVDLEKQFVLRKTIDDKAWIELAQLGTDEFTYTDTTAVEGIIYEYTIASLDYSGNRSLATDVLRLKGMGKLYLDAIENFSLRFDEENKHIDLSWDKSPENIRAYIIYRSVNDGPFRTFKTLKANKLSISDKNILKDRSYEYYIVAVGKNGKKTKKSQILNHVYEKI